MLQGRETVRRILDREDPRVYFEKPRTTTDASNPPTKRKLVALDDLKKSPLHKVFAGKL